LFLPSGAQIENKAYAKLRMLESLLFLPSGALIKEKVKILTLGENIMTTQYGLRFTKYIHHPPGKAFNQLNKPQLLLTLLESKYTADQNTIILSKLELEDIGLKEIHINRPIGNYVKIQSNSSNIYFKLSYLNDYVISAERFKNYAKYDEIKKYFNENHINDALREADIANGSKYNIMISKINTSNTSQLNIDPDINKLILFFEKLYLITKNKNANNFLEALNYFKRISQEDKVRNIKEREKEEISKRKSEINNKKRKQEDLRKSMLEEKRQIFANEEKKKKKDREDWLKAALDVAKRERKEREREEEKKRGERERKKREKENREKERERDRERRMQREERKRERERRERKKINKN